MIPLYTPAQVRAMDERAIAAGTSSLDLMERAAGHLARAVTALAGRRYGVRALFLCGRGNNGGDGVAAARRLLDIGADPRVVMMTGGRELSPDCAVQLERYGSARGRFVDEPDWQWADVVVDCLLGTGSSGPLREPYASVVEELDSAVEGGRPQVVACDLPTGVDADTGQVDGVAVRADATVTLGAAKRGLWLWPARGHCGQLTVADIGIAPPVDEARMGVDDDQPVAAVLSDAEVGDDLPPSYATADKRGRGVVTVVAGSPGMAGAAIMAARGAMAMGVGLLTVATSHGVRDVVAAAVPEALTAALPDGDPDAAFDAIVATLDGADAIAIGPGLGHGEAAVTLIRRLVAEVDVPIVLDADGLNAFRGDGDSLARRASGHLVCTPHAREFARLLGKDVGDVWPQRIHTVTEAARRWRATVVAKGPGTIVESPSGAAWINDTGTAALASGGTGDVLTGMIASAIATAPYHRAAAAAVHVHGLAGRIAARRGSVRSVSAMDVAAAVPAALASLESG